MGFMSYPRTISMRRCTRCGLLTPKKKTKCRHCDELTDIEVSKQLITRKEMLKENRKIAGLFFMIAVLIMVGLVVMYQ